MAKPYINIPVTDAERARIEKIDAAWTGPKLVVLLVITLAFALTVLYLASAGYFVAQKS